MQGLAGSRCILLTPAVNSPWPATVAAKTLRALEVWENASCPEDSTLCPAIPFPLLELAQLLHKHKQKHFVRLPETRHILVASIVTCCDYDNHGLLTRKTIYSRHTQLLDSVGNQTFGPFLHGICGGPGEPIQNAPLRHCRMGFLVALSEHTPCRGVACLQSAAWQTLGARS